MVSEIHLTEGRYCVNAFTFFLSLATTTANCARSPSPSITCTFSQWALTVAFLSMTGIASSYARMLLKVNSYNQLRTEKEDLKGRYSRLEQVAKERDVQVASLGSLASEVSSLYGLKSDPALVTGADEQVRNSEVNSSLDQLYALKNSALTGATTTGLSLGLTKKAPRPTGSAPIRRRICGRWKARSPAHLASVSIRLTGRVHSIPVSISPRWSGQPVFAPADGVV